MATAAPNHLVIGIDLGTSDSYVAYVGKGVVDCVQNEVSQRRTPSLVGFKDRDRLVGDNALAVLKSNTRNTCRNLKHLLGQKLDSPGVLAENFWSACPLAKCDGGNAGFDVCYKGEQRTFSAPEVTAMFLTKLKEITEDWCQGTVADVVIGVPSYFLDSQRQALLDAAKIANLNVLRLMNEHTATALAYGIYRSNDFDPEKPMTVAFCMMGHAIFSVSIVKFVRGKLIVVAEKSAKVGGRDMDECLMRCFAKEFQKKEGHDPLSSKKAVMKLEDAVTKTKKVLSANSEANLSCECLMEDADFSSNMNRASFEEMCQPMMDNVRAVLDEATTLAGKAGVPITAVDAVEMVGGASRVPWVKEMCSKAFAGKDLSTTMNADECVARGCALQAAILSPLFKVRDFKVEDCSPYAYSMSWVNPALDGEQAKTAVVYPANSPLSYLKLLTFFRKETFELTVRYADDKAFPAGASKELGKFIIEVPKLDKPTKVKVKTLLSLHGTFEIEGAQLVEDEMYEETVKEKKEPAPSASEESTPAASPSPSGDESGENKAEGDAAAKKEAEGAESGKKNGTKERKAEWVEVVKQRKRLKRTVLKVTAAGRPRLDAREVLRLTDQELEMQAEMRAVIETNAKKNDLESYILNMRNKIAEGAEYGAFISESDRTAFASELDKAEDWFWDHQDDARQVFIDKLSELRRHGDPVEKRYREDGLLSSAIEVFSQYVQSSRASCADVRYKHVEAVKRGELEKACGEADAWLEERKALWEKAPKYQLDSPLSTALLDERKVPLTKLASEVLREKSGAKGAAKQNNGKESAAAPPSATKEAPKGDVMDID